MPQIEYPQLPTGAFLAAVLVLIPLSWHWRTRNVATLAISAWLFAVDIIYGVNAIVWSGNVTRSMAIWCDISTKIVLGASIAIPAATMCVCKHLVVLSSCRKTRLVLLDRRRQIIFESVMCIGIPIIIMGLHYLVQDHRFDIVENFGCQAAIYVSVPAIMIIWFPQLLLTTLTLIFAVVALNHHMTRRITFAVATQGSASLALTRNRWFRLIGMSLAEMAWGTVITALSLWHNVSGSSLQPWTTWTDVHSDFWRVDLVAMADLPRSTFWTMMVIWWAMPVASIIFFAFFAFSKEAVKGYRQLWRTIRRRVPKEQDLRKPSIASLPISYPILISTEKSNDEFDANEGKTFTLDFPLSSSSNTTFPETPKKGMRGASSYGRAITPSHHRSSSSDTFHCISLYDSYASRSPSPSSTFLPAYQKPSPPPNVYHAAEPRPLLGGILVTIHKQAHVDSIA